MSKTLKLYHCKVAHGTQVLDMEYDCVVRALHLQHSNQTMF